MENQCDVSATASSTVAAIIIRSLSLNSSLKTDSQPPQVSVKSATHCGKVRFVQHRIYYE